MGDIMMLRTTSAPHVGTGVGTVHTMVQHSAITVLRTWCGLAVPSRTIPYHVVA